MNEMPSQSPNVRTKRHGVRAIWAAVFSLACALSGHAQLYLDTNGATTGSGVGNATYSWSTSVANWSSNATGGSATANWTNGSVAFLAAGSDAAGRNYTLSVGSGVTFSGLTLQEGNATIDATGNALTLSGSATMNVLTGNSLAITGSLNLNNGSGTRTLTVNSVGNTDISAIISNSAAVGNLTKTGAGTLTLSGANTYNGLTTVSVGALNIRSNTALGGTTNGTIVSSGAALQTQGNITVTGETLSLNGAGSGSTGALRNISGNNTWTGNITLAGTTTIGSDAGVLTLSNITGTNRALVITGNGTTVITGNVGTGTGTLTKNGAGTLTLNGTSTYTGATTVNAGVLNIQSAGALGGTGNGTTVLYNAALQLQGGITVTGEALTINGTGLNNGGTGALRNISGNNSWTGNVTLANTTTIGSDAGVLTLNNISGANRALTITGNGSTVITGNYLATGNSTLTKTGSGTLTLNGTSSYAGNTVVSGGVLSVQSAGALGGTANGTTVLSGAELQIQNSVTVTGEALTINGTGTGSSGSLRSISGTNVWTGGVTLAANATIGVDAGNLSIGALSDGGVARSLTKVGSGNLTLTNAATSIVNGTTVNVSTGALNLNGANALGNLSNVTLSSGTTLGLGANQTLGALNGSGNVTLASNTLTIGNATNNLSSTYSGNISGAGNLAKAGNGTLTLTTNNSYTGTTNISAGTVNISAGNALGGGTGNITVASGATLQIQGGITVNATNSNRNLVLGGNLESVSGNNSFLMNATVTSNTATITSNTAGQSLTLGVYSDFGVTATNLVLGSNTLTFAGEGDFYVNSNIGQTGNTGGIIKTGNGTLTMAGDLNNYTGTTNIQAGTIVLDTLNDNSTRNTTIRGGLIVGDGVGTGNSAVLRYASGLNNFDKIADNVAVTINSDGLFNLNNLSDTIGALNMTAGNVALGTSGTLTLAGNVTTIASNQTANITGYQLALNDQTNQGNMRQFNIADGSVDDDMKVSAQVTFGGINKTGAGTLTLTNNNTYIGNTTIDAGIVKVQNNAALGATFNGTIVSATGAALHLDGSSSNLTVTDETLTLNGTGKSSDGALRNLAGNNTWTGLVTVAGNSLIVTDNTTQLNFTGEVKLNANATVSTVGNSSVWMNGIVTQTAGLIKEGTGTLYLTGSNSYQGNTTVNAGVLNIRNSNALGLTANGTTVANGAALQMQGGISVGAEALSLSGNGVSNDGALRNISGNNTFGGNITIATNNVRIHSDSGTLNLTGATSTVTMGNNTLTIGGSGDTRIGSQLSSGTAAHLVKEGSGTLTLANSNNSSFAGNVTVSNGTLAMGATGSLNNTAVDLSIATTGTVNLVTYAQTIGTLAGTGALNFGTSGNLTLTGNSIFSGSMSGVGNLIVSSGVTLTLGANFSASGVNIILAGGNLSVNGSNSLFGNLVLTANSTIDFSSTSNSIIRFANMSLSSFSLGVSGWSDEQDFFFVSNDPGNYQSAPLNQVTFGPSGPWVGNDTIWTGDFSGYSTIDEVRPWKPVPEPSTYGAMFMAAGLAIFGYRRWRQSRTEGKR